MQELHISLELRNAEVMSFSDTSLAAIELNTTKDDTIGHLRKTEKSGQIEMQNRKHKLQLTVEESTKYQRGEPYSKRLNITVSGETEIVAIGKIFVTYKSFDKDYPGIPTIEILVDKSEQAGPDFKGFGQEFYRKLLEYIQHLANTEQLNFLHVAKFDPPAKIIGRQMTAEQWQRAFEPVLEEKGYKAKNNQWYKVYARE